MGHSYSNALEHMERGFVDVQRIRGDMDSVRRNLTYKELHNLAMPESFKINTSHVAILYVMDANRDGQFSYDDLVAFLRWVYTTLPKDIPVGDIPEQVQSHCVLKLWKDCRDKNNVVFIDWLCHLLGPTHRIAKAPSMHHFVNAEFVESTEGDSTHSQVGDLEAQSSIERYSDRAPPLTEFDEVFFEPAARRCFDLLCVGETYGMPYPAFLSLLQERDGEESLRGSVSAHSMSNLLERAYEAENGSSKGSSDGEGVNAELTEIRCPVHVMRAFINAFLESYWQILKRLGLEVLLNVESPHRKRGTGY